MNIDLEKNKTKETTYLFRSFINYSDDFHDGIHIHTFKPK